MAQPLFLFLYGLAPTQKAPYKGTQQKRYQLLLRYFSLGW